MRCLKYEFKERDYPELAGELFEREKIFRDYNISLERTVQSYNRLTLKTKEVEFNLIAHEMKEFDEQLKKAEGDLNWNSEGELRNVFLKLLFFNSFYIVYIYNIDILFISL